MGFSLTAAACLMRVLVLVACLVQLALYGAAAPSGTGADFLRLTEGQRLYSDSPAQVAILTSKPLTAAVVPEPDIWHRIASADFSARTVSGHLQAVATCAGPQMLIERPCARDPPQA